MHAFSKVHDSSDLYCFSSIYDYPHQTKTTLFFVPITTLRPSPWIAPPTHAKSRTRWRASQPRQAHSRTKPIAIVNPLRAMMPADRANGESRSVHFRLYLRALHRHPQPEPRRLCLGLTFSPTYAAGVRDVVIGANEPSENYYDLAVNTTLVKLNFQLCR